MARDFRMAWTRNVLTIGIACLMGCQHTGPSGRARSGPSPGAEMPSSPITTAQEADAQISLGRAAEIRGDLGAARAAYQAALARDGSRADCHQRMAVLADKQGKFRESADLYRLAMKGDPGNPEIYCDMGYSLYLQRRWAEAEMNLHQAIVLDPDNQRAHNNLGMVLARDGRPDDALVEFRKGGCGEAQARENLALARATEGRWDEARGQYQLALRAQPSSETARARLAEVDRLIARAGTPSHPAAPVDPEAIAASADRAPATAAGPPAVGPRPIAPPRTETGP